MADWSTLPLLPLTCILNHLRTEEAVRAMSTCRHWRSASLLYEGRRETLKLNIKQLDKCKYLIGLFRRSVRSLHLYIDCNAPEIEKFMNLVFPMLFDIPHIKELIFVGPSFVQQSNHIPFIRLRRITIETFVFKNTMGMVKLGFVGCGLDTPVDENEKFCHKTVQQHSRELNFNFFQCPEDNILTRGNQHMMQFSSIEHIIADVEQITTCTLETLSALPHFNYLTLNVTNKRLGSTYQPIDWESLDNFFQDSQLRVGVNIIGVPFRRFEDIMEKVLLTEMKLVSLKVLFCRSIYSPLLSHASQLYRDTLREMVWVDAPHESSDPYHRIVRPIRLKKVLTTPRHDILAHVNPFVLLCWQCNNLERLVIHGYWIWQYDVLGFVRLRKDLLRLEVSAIYYQQSRFQNLLEMSEEGAIRVLGGDNPGHVDPDHLREVNEFLTIPWRPTPWLEMPAALRARASTRQRADYILQEACSTLPVTFGGE